ncbi:O-antigen ligase family protein [Flavobacterium sp.]|uniref:O-antigen ligase family protein n=1 Tax=Flavobacterium sp. TaxID=239 RepID=UPI004047CCAB
MRAIAKEITLLLIPIAFIVLQPIAKDFKEKVLKYYSYTIIILVLYYLIRSVIRYFVLKKISVFFYHGDYHNDFGLVPKELNAIYVSVFVSIAFFYFLTKELKTKFEYFITLLLFFFVLLLSSKNIIIIITLLILLYLLFYSKISNKMRLRNLILFVSIIGVLFFFGKIKDRFKLEFYANTNNSISSNVINQINGGVHNVSIYEAWHNKKFTQNDFFNGTSFRVYQIRMFLEILSENKIFWQGIGLNASQLKLEEKGKEYNVFLGKDHQEGYQKKNFHNQYIQVFAELGFFGFILLVLMLLINLKKAINHKDFIHIAFAVLMISVFLTESFLWRQRGVVFFIVFYCLFNSKEIKFNSKENK